MNEYKSTRRNKYNLRISNTFGDDEKFKGTERNFTAN